MDASPELGGKSSFTYGALVVADDLGNWVLCFVCGDLVHSNFDEGVSCVSAFSAILVMMIACVDAGLVLSLRWLVFLKD